MSKSDNPFTNSGQSTKDISHDEAVEKTRLVVPDLGVGYQIQKKDSQGNIYTEEVTNFSLEKQAVVCKHDSAEKEVVLQVHPAYESSYTVTVDYTVFNEPRKFRDKVVLGETTTFNGGREELNELRKLVGLQDVPTLEKTRSFGLHVTEGLSEWVGIDESWGYLDTPNYHYDKRGTTIEQQLSVDNSDYDDDQVRDFLRLITQSRDRERWLPVIGWFYSVTVAPHIREEENEIGSLSVTGDTGVGKTESMDMMAEAFGLGSLLSPTSKEYILLREMSGSTSVPLVYDEVKSSEMTPREMDTFRQFSRSATKGRLEGKGNYGSADNTYLLKAPIAIIGEMQFGNNSEQRRLMHTVFRDPHSTPGAVSAWSELRDTVDPSHHAEMVHQSASDVDDIFDDLWQQVVDNVKDFQSEYGYDITGLERTSLRQIELGRLMFEQYCEAYDVPDESIPTKDEWWDAMDYIASSMGAKERTSHLDELMELASILARNGRISEDNHYRLMGGDNDDDELRIKVDDITHEASKYLREHDLDGYDLLNASDYKERMNDLLDMAGYVVEKRKDGVINRCYVLDTDKLDEEVEGFELQDFKNYN